MNKSVYRPSIPRWLQLCGRNYHGLLKLLPDVDTESLDYCFNTTQGVFRIVIEACSPFTTTLNCRHVPLQMPEVFNATLRVRLYHDVQVAEVLSCRQHSQLRAKYPYPNEDMYQPDEREQHDRFLAEWIGFCSSSQLLA